jgi:hypothetical protein
MGNFGHNNNNKDIIIKNKREKTSALIDVLTLADRNDVRKEAEKEVKHKGLCIQIQRMWDLKCKITPVTIAPTGMTTKGLGKNLEATPGTHSVE